MPLYIIIGHDVANSSEKRALTRPAHLARLEQLQAENRLVLAGPTPIEHGDSAMSGSVIIAEFADDDSLRQWVNDEPYLINGVYSHVETRPFVMALGSALSHHQ